MPTEVRIYTIKPGRFDEFLGLFREHIMPTSRQYGVNIHAGWRNHDANEWVWVRSYDDEATIERYNTSPERAGYSPSVLDCIESTEIRTVEPEIGEISVANA